MDLYDNKKEFEKLWCQVEAFSKALSQPGNKLDIKIILLQETFDGLFTQLYAIAQESQIGHEF